MQSVTKRIASIFLVPLVKWYLKKTRSFTYKQITVNVPPGVFHPGLFHSTKFLLTFLSRQELRHKKLLELGSGSGLIAIYAAKAGAQVTAIDLNPDAVGATEKNATDNQVDIAVIQSDLFQNLPQQTFDWIIINPPYYPRPAKNDMELAWHCGDNFEYFTNLFTTLVNYTNSNSSVIMVLSQDCDLERIKSIAQQQGKFIFKKIEEKSVWIDGKNFLFQIHQR